MHVPKRQVPKRQLPKPRIGVEFLRNWTVVVHRGPNIAKIVSWERHELKKVGHESEPARRTAC